MSDIRERLWRRLAAGAGVIPACDKQLMYEAKEELEKQKTEIERLKAESQRLRADGDDMAHVIVEAGVVFGEDDGCRCDRCRNVATKMAEAGYLERVTDRWWEEAT